MCVTDLQKQNRILHESNSALQDRINELQDQCLNNQQDRVQTLLNRGLLQHVGETLDRAGVDVCQGIGTVVTWLQSRRARVL